MYFSYLFRSRFLSSKMKSLGFPLLALTLLTACTKVQTTEAFNKNSISTSISSVESLHLGTSVAVTFSLTNNSNKTIHFLKWGTPFESTVTRDQFSIFHKGLELPYKGRMVKRAPPTERDYIKLGPNKSLKTTIDIRKSYDFSKPGIYTVTYKESFLEIKTVEGLYRINKSNSLNLNFTQ